MFYSKLYANSGVDSNLPNDNIFFKDLPKLSSDSREICEGKITEGECMAVLKEMKQNKTPGNDGLSVEFYLSLWPVIGDVVVGALNEAFCKGELIFTKTGGYHFNS